MQNLLDPAMLQRTRMTLTTLGQIQRQALEMMMDTARRLLAWLLLPRTMATVARDWLMAQILLGYG